MNSYFSGNSYRTAHVARHPLDRIFLGSRWGLYFGLLGAVLEARRSAIRGTFDDEFWARSSHRVFRHIEACGGRFTIDGFDNLRRLDSPVVFASNHMSALETQVLPVLMIPFFPVTFVVKTQLTQGALFGPVMSSTNPVTVNRDHPGEDLMRVLEGGVERIKTGVSVIVFPQSTRSAVFDPRYFNTLGAKLAHRANVSLVPIAVKTDFWENGRLLRGYGPIKRNRQIHIEFGKPIPSELSSKATHAKTVEFIRGRLDSWS